MNLNKERQIYTSAQLEELLEQVWDLQLAAAELQHLLAHSCATGVEHERQGTGFVLKVGTRSLTNLQEATSLITSTQAHVTFVPSASYGADDTEE